MLTEIHLLSGEKQNPFQHNESKRRRAIKITRTLVLNLWCRMILFPVLPAALSANSPEAYFISAEAKYNVACCTFSREIFASKTWSPQPSRCGAGGGVCVEVENRLSCLSGKS